MNIRKAKLSSQRSHWKICQFGQRFLNKTWNSLSPPCPEPKCGNKSGENANNNILRTFTLQNFCFSDVSPEFWLAYKKLKLKLKDKDGKTCHFLGGCSPSSSPRLLFSAIRKASWIVPWPTHAEKVVLWAGDYFDLQEKLCINSWTFICRFIGQVQVERTKI